MASHVAIKMLGANGGGFFNANAAHPFENLTALSNFIQMVSVFAIDGGSRDSDQKGSPFASMRSVHRGEAETAFQFWGRL